MNGYLLLGILLLVGLVITIVMINRREDSISNYINEPSLNSSMNYDIMVNNIKGSNGQLISGLFRIQLNPNSQTSPNVWNIILPYTGNSNIDNLKSDIESYYIAKRDIGYDFISNSLGYINTLNWNGIDRFTSNDQNVQLASV